MSRLITLECDPTEIRLAIGSSQASGISVDQLYRRPLAIDPADELIGNEKVLDAARDLLKQANIKSGNVIVSIGRSYIELRSLTLPTVDANELPDMVRFAALRQFANANETWPIDFVAIPSNVEGSTECLAASMNPDVIERVRAMVSSLGLTFNKLVLRPMASASLAVIYKPELASKTVLLVDLLPHEADAVVVDHGNVVFMRTFRFTEAKSVEANEHILYSEIKRTLLAATSQRAGLDIDMVAIWGTDERLATVCAHLTQSVGLPIIAIDPVRLVAASAQVQTTAGDDTGRFAPLFGALLAPHHSYRMIDFTNPRKREEKELPYRTFALAGVAATLLLGGLLYWYWSSHRELDFKIAESKRLQTLDVDILKKAAMKVDDWRAVQSFLKGDYHWLDELNYLSQKAIDSDSAVLSGTTFVLEPRTNRATILTKIYLKSQDDWARIQEALRDDNHELYGDGVSPVADRMYPWIADLNINLGAHEVADPRIAKPARTVESKPVNDAKETMGNQKESSPPAESDATEVKSTDTSPATQDSPSEKPQA